MTENFQRTRYQAEEIGTKSLPELPVPPKEIDAYIAEISGILQHPNADRLEIATIRNWRSVVGKGEFTPGDVILYVQPDAMINKPNEANDMSWAEGIRTYLGKNGRVKIVNLRGEISNGLIVKLSTIKDYLINRAEEAGLITKSPTDFISWVKELDSLMLCSLLGITHYVAPVPQCLEARSVGMPLGVEKSDETNFQSLRESDLHIGETVLVTRKMDGMSATLYYNPNTDELSMHSRSMNLYMDKDNSYTIAMRPYIEHVKEMARHFGEPFAIRGEVCGAGANAHKVNEDAKKPLGFYMYGTRSPENADSALRYGRWKSGRHFLDVNKILVEHGFTPIPTVPVLGETIITMDKLREWENAPASLGEGVVVNGTWESNCSTSSYKAKSALYYAAMK